MASDAPDSARNSVADNSKLTDGHSVASKDFSILTAAELEALSPTISTSPRHSVLTTAGLEDPSESTASEILRPVSSVQPETLSPAEYEKKRMRRFLVIQELYETEKGYVNDLNNLVRNFLDPLNSAYLAGVAVSVQYKPETTNAAEIVQNTTFGNEQRGVWITFDQKQSIVRNASNLLRVQKLFLKLMEEAVKSTTSGATATEEQIAASGGLSPDPSVLQVARCFLTMMSKLEGVYLPFCSQHDTALETLATIKKSHPYQLQTFVDECRGKMNTKLEIQDFLIKPVQRICKYPLLMKEILKGTIPNTPDYFEMTEAFDKIRVLVSAINEKKKVAENERKKDVILSRLNSGNSNGIQLLGAAFNFAFDEDTKTIPVNQTGQDLINQIGQLQKGGGLNVNDLGTHDFPFSAQINPQNEINYLGVFMFPEIILVLWPKKSSLYHTIHVIPFKDIVNVQELTFDAVLENQLFKSSFRISWSVKYGKFVAYRSIDLGAKSDKEKYSWLDQISKFLPADKIQFHSASSEAAESENYKTIGANQSRASLPLKRAGESGVLPSGKEESLAPTSAEDAALVGQQMQVDLKFSEVYTTESLVMNSQQGSKGSKGQTHSSGLSSSSNVPNSSGTLKGLFRKSSQNRGPSPSLNVPVTMENNTEKQDDKSGVTRRPSQKKSRPLSMFGTSSTSKEDSEDYSKRALFSGNDLPSLNNVSGDNNGAPEPSPIANVQSAKKSITDMANAVKKLVRARSSSVSNLKAADTSSQQNVSDLQSSKHKSGSRSSVAQDTGEEGDKKWGSGIKGKIMAVGKFARRKSISSTNIADMSSTSQLKSSPSTDTVNQGKDVKGSNVSLAQTEAGDKKKSGFFSSLTRSMSKRKQKDSLSNNVPADAKSSQMELSKKSKDHNSQDSGIAGSGAATTLSSSAKTGTALLSTNSKESLTQSVDQSDHKSQESLSSSQPGGSRNNSIQRSNNQLYHVSHSSTVDSMESNSKTPQPPSTPNTMVPAPPSRNGSASSAGASLSRRSGVRVRTSRLSEDYGKDGPLTRPGTGGDASSTVSPITPQAPNDANYIYTPTPPPGDNTTPTPPKGASAVRSAAAIRLKRASRPASTTATSTNGTDSTPTSETATSVSGEHE